MKIKLSELKSRTVMIFVKSPFEIILSFLYLLFGFWVTWTSEPYFGSVLYNLKFYFFPCVGLVYAMNITFPTGRGRLLYYASLLSPLLAYFYLIYGSASDLTIIVTIFCVIILMFIGAGWRDNRKFTHSAIARSLNLSLSAILSGIAMLSMMAVYASFIFIFNLEPTGEEYLLTILDLGMYAFFPFLFLLFEHNEKYEITRNRFSEILFNYILTPAIVLFGVILYIYFAKIIFLWELPKGGISATAIAFLTGGIIVQACMLTLKKHIWNWFFDYFRFIALLVLGMLWVAVMYRVMEYGLTDRRVYLLVSVVVLSVWIFAQFFKRANVYHYLSCFTVLFFLAFTYLPFINANAVQKRFVANIDLKSDADSPIFQIRGSHSSVDISGYAYTLDAYGTIEKDSLVIYSYDDKQLLLRIDGVDFFDKLMRDCGMANYQELPPADIKRLSNPLVYRDNTIILIFDSIDFRVTNGKYTPIFVNIKSAITK